MAIDVWKTVEKQVLKNAEIAASDVEEIITGTQNVDAYNMLIVQNLDANSDVEVRLNFNESTGPQEKFFVQKNGGFINLGPDIPIWFNKLFLNNLNGAAVVAADKVNVRVAKVVPKIVEAINEGVEASGRTSNQTGIILG